MTAVPDLLAGLPVPTTVVADRGYDSNAVLDLIRRSGAEPAIPSTSQRTVRRSVDMAIYRQQLQIDALLGELQQVRQQQSDSSSGAPRNLRDELPPHY